MTTKKTTWKQITEKEFAYIKQLQDMGLNASKVSVITKRGNGTIYYIFASNTIEEYRQRQKEAKNKSRKPILEQIAPLDQNNFIEYNYDPALQDACTNNIQDTTNSNLERIAVALEALVEAWNSEPKRKRLF